MLFKNSNRYLALAVRVTTAQLTKAIRVARELCN